MKVVRTPSSRLLALPGLLALSLYLAGEPSAWASLSACNPPPSPSYDLGNGANGLAPGGGYAAGCEQTNLQFSNFTAFVNSPGIAEAFSGFSETGGITVDATSGLFTGPNATITIEYTTQVDTTVAPPPGAIGWFITGLELDADSVIFGGSTTGGAFASVSVTDEFCTGTTTFNCNFNDGNYGEMEFQVSGNAASSSYLNVGCYHDGVSGAGECSSVLPSGNAISVSLGIGTQVVTVIEEITVQSRSGATVSLSGLSLTEDQTAETPEPSSLLLVAGALAAAMIARGAKRATKFTSNEGGAR